MSVLSAQIINWIIFIVVIAGSVGFIGRDTRKRCLSWRATVVWVLLATFTFPVGFGFYFLDRQKSNDKGKVTDK